jgi:hypothetical protein
MRVLGGLSAILTEPHFQGLLPDSQFERPNGQVDWICKDWPTIRTDPHFAATVIRLLDGRGTRPMRLCSIRPDCARRQKADPGLCESIVHNPISLHAGLSLHLTGFRICPFERKAEPSAVA